MVWVVEEAGKEVAALSSAGEPVGLAWRQPLALASLLAWRERGEEKALLPLPLPAASQKITGYWAERLQATGFTWFEQSPEGFAAPAQGRQYWLRQAGDESEAWLLREPAMA